MEGDTTKDIPDTTNINDLLDSPIRGHPSTTSSNPEPFDTHDAILNKLAVKTFAKTEEYILNELNLPIEDYKLLTKMNKATLAKYSDLQQISKNLNVSINVLNDQFQALVPLVTQIDEISDTVDKLEAAAYKLDAYSVALENRVKSIILRTNH